MALLKYYAQIFKTLHIEWIQVKFNQSIQPCFRLSPILPRLPVRHIDVFPTQQRSL
jgi:hypothetical protein